MNDELDMRAAEFVLGTLDASERYDFKREMDADPEARDAVADWQRRLSPLASLAPPLAPPSDMWSRIERALPPAAAPTVSADNIVALRRTATNWRRAAIFSGALAAGLGLFVVRQEVFAPKQAGVYFAAVNRGGELPALIVRVDLATQTIYVRPVSAETPEGKSLQLWVIPPGEKPKSLGVIPAGSQRLPEPKGFAIEKALFAVSVEPKGGSPTDGPTGPIVYTGALVRE